MNRFSRVSSKSEAHARVRCRGEENKLSCIKHELDKVLHAHSRVLGTNRNRFILDRRRSLNNVYNSQIEGIQPHLRIRYRRRDSAPEVFEIFRRQEDRRRSIKVMEKALTQDAMNKLERKYQEALGRHRSDIDEEDALLAPNIDIEGPDYEEGERNHGKTRKKGVKPGEADREKIGKERKEEEREKDQVESTKKETEPEETRHGKITEKQEEVQEEKDHRKTRKKGDEEDAKGLNKLRKNEDDKEERDSTKTAKKEREQEGKGHVETKNKEPEQRRKDEEKKKNKESDKERKGYREERGTETLMEKNDYRKTDRENDDKHYKKTENERDPKDYKKTTKQDNKKDEKDYNKSRKSGSDKDDTDDRKAKRKGSEKDEKDDDKEKKKKGKEKDHSKANRPQKTKADSSESSPQYSKTSNTGHPHTSTQPQPKTSHSIRNDTRYEDRNNPRTDNHKHTREDSTNRGIKSHHSTVPKHMPSSPVETRKIPQRKRSHSDGNIFMNLLELEDTLRQTYELSKAAAEAAAEAAAAEAARSDEEDSEDGGRMLFRGQAWVQTGRGDYSPSHSYSEMSENEPSDVEMESSRPHPRMRKRRVGQVSLEFSALENADVKWQMHEHDVTSRFQNGRRGSYPHSEEIRLSPSLQRRLANVSQSPRHHQDLRDDLSHSPSMTRRRADVSCSPSMLRHHADVSYFSPIRRAGVIPTNDRDSPTRWKKDDKPKPIYHQGEAEKTFKRRPLRRSRSEAFDVSALVTEREKHGVGVNLPRAGRRGSDSIQDLSTARMGRNLPRGWNSLLLGLALTQEEKEDIARHKRKELVTSLRKRQEEVDSDVSRRIRTFLQRYDDA